MCLANRRTDLAIVRELDPTKKAAARMIRCPVMLVAGDSSPHLDETVSMNIRMDPETCSWMKVSISLGWQHYVSQFQIKDCLFNFYFFLFIICIFCVTVPVWWDGDGRSAR